MTNREPTIFELCRYYDKGMCSLPIPAKKTPECIREACVVFEGYTRQPRPNRLELVAEKQVEEDLRKFRRASPISNENYQINCQPKPSEKLVEAVADIIKLCLDTDPFDPAGGMPEEIAREILSLFPEPVLTRISDTEIGDALDLEVEAQYPRSDGSSVSTVSVDRLLEAQLAHIQQQIKGE